MSMLAERRQKQKWTLNPRGKFWTEDSNKIGQKMLEKMGWTKGKGLGINEQGITEIYSVSHKSDTTGMGYDKNFEEWTEHQEKFGNFLQQLNGNRDQDAVKDGDTNLSGQSIELKSKQSRARVHYKKFTRGKDINKYKLKDLANIFGQKELAEKTQVKVEKDDSIRETEAPDFKDWYGVNTINCGNMVEYFKHKSNYSNKSDYLKCNVKSNNDTSLSSNVPDNQRTDSESENDQHVGFGFAPKTVDTSLSSCGALKDSDDKSHYAFDNPCLGLNSSIETAYSTNGFSVESAKKKKKKFESDSLHITEVDKHNTRKKLKTETSDSDCKNGFINPALNLDTKPEEDCNGKEFEVFRTPINLENCNGSSTKSTKKRKKEFESDSLHITEVDKHNTRKKLKAETIDSDCKNGFINPALNLDTKPEEDRNGKEFEVFRAQIGLENCNGSSTKLTKKRKKEFDSLHITEVDKHNTRKKLKAETIDSDCKNGFINPALNLGTNPEEDRNGKEFEVFRAQFGLENCGLDLMDERNNKKRVTFNDHVMLYEYNINSAKKKKGEVTLDKFEVENKKSKKKRKRESTTTPVTNGFVNEALDVQILYEEINDNELNEHRNKKIKRKISKTSNLETIQESPEKEIIEINTESEDTLDISIVENGETDTMEQQSKKKKKKKEKKEKKAKVEDITVLRVINEETGIEIEKTIGKKIKKDKESKEEETAISKKCKKKKKKDKENCKSEKHTIQTEINNEQQDIKILEKSDSKQQNDLIENENKDAAVIETLSVSTTKEEEEKEEEPLEKIKHKKNKRKSISKEDCLNHQNIEILDKSDSKLQNDYLIEQENKDAAIIETLPVPTTKEEEKEEGLLEKIKHKKKKRKSIGKEDGSSQIDVCSVEREISDKENTDKEQDPNTKKLEKKDKKSKKSKDKNVSDDVGDSSNPNKEVVNVNVMKQDKIENAEPTDTPSKKSKVIDAIDNIINSPWNVKARMSKRMLITLFHNNAISEFPGSNINNIKGYGTDEYDL